MSQIPNQTQPLPINPDKPIDGVLGTLIADARARNRGFALSVAQDVSDQGKDITFTVEQTLPPADEWEPPAPYRQHIVNDVDSLVAMAKKYSSAADGLILVNDAGVTLILNECPYKGKRERVTLDWEFSKAWQEWSTFVNGEPQQHKPLFKFLTRRQADLAEPEVLQAMRSIKATATVKLDSNLRDLGESVGVIFETTAGDDLVKFPKDFEVCLSVFEDGDRATIRLNVEIGMPQEPRAPVTFMLLSEQWDRVKREAIKGELAKLRAALPDWTIVRGEHDELQRQIGRPK